MLSLSAFNALLKTLEEPPKHVVFIFATTEAQKIPLTVLGRCQRFEFRRLTQAEIVERLEHILGVEKVRIEEAGLRLIASHSDGSLRDALSLLDQVLSYANRNEAAGALTEKEVVGALGVSETSAVSDFLKFVLRKDLKGVLSLIGDNYLAGVDLKHFSERCLEELRLLYLAVLARESGDVLTAESLDMSATRLAALQELAKDASLVQLERMAQILSKAISQIAWSSLPRFVLEMAAVRMSKLDELAEVEAKLLAGAPIEVAAPPVQAAAPVARAVPIAPVSPRHEGASPATPLPSPQPSPMPPHTAQPQGGGVWENFVDAVKKRKPLLFAILRHAHYKLDADKNGVRGVTVEFPDRNADLALDRRRDIEEQVKIHFGPQTEFTFSSSNGTIVNSIATTRQAEAAVLKKEALTDPKVIQLKGIGAEIVDIPVDLED
jgi:DNA polymerase III gamma/tau subunit